MAEEGAGGLSPSERNERLPRPGRSTSVSALDALAEVVRAGRALRAGRSRGHAHSRGTDRAIAAARLALAEPTVTHTLSLHVLPP